MPFGEVNTATKKVAAAVGKKPPASRQSGGTSGNLSIPGYIPQTPTVTYNPSEPSHIPGVGSLAGGAQRRKRAARSAQRQRVSSMLHRDKAKRQRRSAATEKRVQRTERAIKAKRYVPPKANPGKQSELEVKAFSTPQPTSKPVKFQGAKTAGAPTLKSLQRAQKTGMLRVNKQGFATTPEIRSATKKVKQARKVVARSQPSLAGLSGAERAVVPLVRKAHRKFPDIPKSLMMAQIKQESGFNAAAVSSAGAQGLTQFIPSTAASYGVKYGTGPKEKQSQVTGQARLLHSDHFATDPQGALSAYSGGYAPADYNNPILSDAKASYGALDKPGSPKAVKRLQMAKAQARKLGLQVSGSKAAVGPAPNKVVTRFKVIKKAAAALTARHIPYVLGGGHGALEANPQTLDCSGAVSWVLSKAGVLKTPLVSGDMGSVLKPGPGAVTVFYNADHTFMKIGNEYWGTSAGDNGAGGLGPHPAPSAAYLAQYNVGHVPGLGKKQALQLGIKPGAVSSFPGMSLSSSGTTATIESGAGATKAKPGFSKKPIQLTAQQRYRRTGRKLKEVGVGGATATEAEVSPTLTALEKKYGAKAA